mmetsp:Transcript_27856/g.26695  ORF Transcript_27856/g.26695 Transcript_27856/m.26695 type:complete len:378 (+) Transcript_27856:31-1164(+)
MSFLVLAAIFTILCCCGFSFKLPVSQTTRGPLHAVVGSKNLDWTNLGFEYSATESFVKCEYKNGEWGEVTLENDPYVKIHIGSTALHYGQACFEGMKAFHTKEDKVCIFRPDENLDRITRSSTRVCMPPLPEKKFLDAVKLVVKENLAYVPPYGTGGALYIRPLIYGSGARIGLQPSDEYMFIAMVLPVADYYKGGLKPVPAMVVEGYDRAAPQGVGSAKVAGNYAADLMPNMAAKKAGFPIALYLDAKTHTLVEEFSTSNFLAIDKKSGAYVTPISDAILASITNKSLMQIAEDEGIEVQRRPVAIEEVMDGNFSEVAACGTAVVVTPVNKIVYMNRVAQISEGLDVGPVTRKLYNRVRGIQNGEAEDKFGWMIEV